MKYFKHLARSANDNLIFEAIEKFGGDGYMVFFVVLEIYADEFNIRNPEICQFSFKKLRKNCQISAKKLTKILRFFNEKAEKNAGKQISFYVEFANDQLIISCPKFIKLADDYTRKKMQFLKNKNPDKLRTLAGKLPKQTTDNRLEIKELDSAGHSGRSKNLIEKNYMAGLMDEIIKKCERIEKLKKQIPKELNIFAWVQDKINICGHPKAIVDSLDSVIERWPTIELPWAYATAIFKLKNGNYWESEHIEQAKRFKEQCETDPKILEKIGYIGSGNPDNEKICF
jgi:hypothetical protein